jgi:anti-sigma regulatory factor (Ser/Thr protein kinase)
VAIARRALDAHRDGRLDQGAVEDARLMLSELASNAVRHACGPYEVDFELDARRARVTVSDRGQGFAPPRLQPDDLGTLSEGGRGLAIVDRLSTRWGIDRGPAGTRVWFELDR